MGKRLYTWLLLSLGVVTGALAQSMTISGGNDHGLIICAEGYLYTWGKNYNGQGQGPVLGIDDQVSGYDDQVVYTPKKVKSGNLTFNMVTSGSGAFNLALACNGIVYAWGENTQAGCGQGNTDPVVPYPVPVHCGEAPGYNEDGSTGGPYLGNVKYIAATTAAGFAILGDGRVVAWGGKNNESMFATYPTTEPIFVKKKDGSFLTGVTHVSGGDDNVYFRTEDGQLYAMGLWNGGNSANAQGVTTYAGLVLRDDDGTPLSDIRMSAAGDVAGYAVTGDGFVWAWGNAGWGGCTGTSAQTTHARARRVISGEYKTISNENYLTDVKELIGGRGYGAAVTKEGYLVYWGCIDALENRSVKPTGGGIAPVSDATALQYSAGGGNQGVKPVLARYCDASGKPGEIVKDAVSISRGDIFGYMVNDKDEYYTWGSNLYGECGTGARNVEFYQCLTKLTTVPCEIQDVCPSVFMVDVKKCPGEKIELDCGFVVPKRKEDRYYIEWYRNDGHGDEKLNTSTLMKGANGYWTFDASYLLDDYNKSSIFVTEPGTYKVIAYYIGENIPCDACSPDTAISVVTEMDMPIDTIITEMNCVFDPKHPSASDNICFEAVVNDKFYKSTETASFAAFSTESSSDTLSVVTAKGSGGALKYCVTGDKLDPSGIIYDGSDTLYTLWVEDVTEFETKLLERKTPPTSSGAYFGNYTQIIKLSASSFLKSFSFYVSSSNGGSITIQPIIYKAGEETSGGYNLGQVFWTGRSQKTTIEATDGVVEVVVDCDVLLPANSMRGTEYVLAAKVTIDNTALYTAEVGGSATQQGGGSTSVMYTTPIEDSERYGIMAIGSTANQTNNPNRTNPYWNIIFGKKTDYDCGRIMLSAKLGCPPCTSPDEVKMLVDGVAKTSDTISLCEESPAVELSVEDIKSTQKPSAAFDVLWFVDQLGNEDDADQVDPKVTSSIYKTKIKWSAAKEGTTEKYYVRGRDNEKPTSSKCFVEDSVVVKYNKKPVVPTIEIPSFCKGLVDDAVKSYLNNDLKTLLNGLKADILDPSNAPVAVADLATSLNALAAGTQTYKIAVTDIATGCISDVSSFEVVVKAIPDKPSVNDIDFLVSEETSQPVGDGVPAQTGDIHWYSNKSDFPANPSTTVPTVSLKEEKTFTFWVSKNVDGCESDTSSFLVTVNDAPMPGGRDTLICVQNSVTNPNPSVDLSTLVTAGDPAYPNTVFTLNWYTDPNASKGSGSATVPTVDYTKEGVQTFYVSQTNGDTHAESNKKAISVKIYKAHTLSPIASDTYCDEEQNPRALVKFAEDGTTDYEKESDIQWYLYGDAWDADKLPVLGIKKDTTYVFGAVQYYTITSTTGDELETCYSDTTYYTVNVLYTSPVGDSSVAYIAAEVGADNKTFPSIDTKEGWSEEPGYTYYYSEAGANNFS
nr:hypothetical protein [Paludibacteraceae bacterium]